MSAHLPLPSEAMREQFAALAGSGRRELSFERAGLEFPAWQQRLRAALRDLLAVDDHPPHPVRGETLSEEQCDGYRRLLVRVQGRDGAMLPAYWLIPDDLSAPVGVLLALHGHGPGKVKPAGLSVDLQDRPVDIGGGRDYAVQAARRGYCALAPDLRGFGEMILPEEHSRQAGYSCTEMFLRAAMAGQCLLGMRVRDLSSWVDWLLTQPQVDPERIFCTGQSGGGTATVWAAALDPRISAAAPSCGLCTFEHSYMAIHHCPCNYVPGVLRLAEYYDVAGLIAPRPQLVITGALDSIFPLPGVQAAYRKLEEIYRAAGAPERLELYVGGEGHRFYAARLWDFLALHFPPRP